MIHLTISLRNGIRAMPLFCIVRDIAASLWRHGRQPVQYYLRSNIRVPFLTIIENNKSQQTGICLIFLSYPYGKQSVSYRNKQGTCTLKFRCGIGKMPMPLLGETPNTPSKERSEKMNEPNATRIYVRMTQREKSQIERYASSCGLPVAEYMRKRALGYSPKPTVPDAFYSFYGKLCELSNDISDKVSADTETELIVLISDIQRELLLPEKRNTKELAAETEAMTWRPPDSGP